MRRGLLFLMAVLPCSGFAKSVISDAPAGVAFTPTVMGRVFATRDHKTLYTLSMRTVRARAGFRLGADEYCTGPCADLWTPLIPAKDAVPVGDWTILKYAHGVQWAYKLNPVFTFNADQVAGDRKGDNYMEMWLAIPYVPPKPKFAAPATVEARLIDDAYALTDTQGHPLLLGDGKAGCDCAPFAAGMASLPVGAWSVLREQDAPQWALNGAPVYVSLGNTTSGKVIHP